MIIYRRSGWNEYQISLENRISEDQKTLSRKEQYISNQEFLIEKLTREKQDLHIQLLDETEERASRELDKNNRKQVEQLSAIIEEMKAKYATVVETYNGEINKMR